MNQRFCKSSPRGLTLVEVIAGLALLSTLLVAVLSTKARVTRQWSHAQRRLEAVRAADALLARWWGKPNAFPRHDSGHLAGDAGLVWRTMPLSNSTAAALRASVVRLEVLDEHSPGEGVLASAEILLDDDPPAEPQRIMFTGGVSR